MPEFEVARLFCNVLYLVYAVDRLISKLNYIMSTTTTISIQVPKLKPAHAALHVVQMSLWNAKNNGTDYAIWNDADKKKSFPPYAFGCHLRKGVLYRHDIMTVSVFKRALIEEAQWCRKTLDDVEKRMRVTDNEKPKYALLYKIRHDVTPRFNAVKTVCRRHDLNVDTLLVTNADSVKKDATLSVYVGQVKCIENGDGKINGNFIRRVKKKDSLVHVEVLPCKSVLSDKPHLRLQWLLTLADGWVHGHKCDSV